MKTKIKKTIATLGLVGVLGMSEIGCETTPAGNALGEYMVYQAIGSAISGSLDPKGTNVVVNTGNQQQTNIEKRIEVFTCNDINDRGEVIGRKKSKFYLGEDVSIIEKIQGYSGDEFKIDLIYPDGRIKQKQYAQNIPYEITIAHLWWKNRDPDLIVGKYTIIPYINGEEVMNPITFEIIERK